jgi:CO/xanthine dehydrogenase Mo-binding subunit
MHFRTALDGGAYGSYGVASLYYTGALQTVTYQVARYKFEGVRVFTNKPPCGPKRGHGTPQPRFALECHIDKFCADLGLDPARWRLDHTVAPGTITANQMQVRTIGCASASSA